MWLPVLIPLGPGCGLGVTLLETRAFLPITDSSTFSHAKGMDLGSCGPARHEERVVGKLRGMSTARQMHLFMSPHHLPFTRLSSDPESGGRPEMLQGPLFKLGFQEGKIAFNMILLLLEVGCTCCNAILWHCCASMGHSPSAVLRAVWSMPGAWPGSTAPIAETHGGLRARRESMKRQCPLPKSAWLNPLAPSCLQAEAGVCHSKQRPSALQCEPKEGLQEKACCFS